MADKDGDDKSKGNDEPDADVGGFGLDTEEAGDVRRGARAAMGARAG